MNPTTPTPFAFTPFKLLSPPRHDAYMVCCNTSPYVRQDREDIHLGPEHDYPFPPPRGSDPTLNLSSFSSCRSTALTFLSVQTPHGSSRPIPSLLLTSHLFRDFEHPEGHCVKLEDHRIRHPSLAIVCASTTEPSPPSRRWIPRYSRNSDLAH